MLYFRLYEANDPHKNGSKKSSVVIQGLAQFQVQVKLEIYSLLERGSAKRQTAETKLNATSSRSHTVFTITVHINQQSIDGEDM